MTRTTIARIAGVTFWIYIAAGIASMSLAGIPSATALGVIASVFLVMFLPLQIAGFFGGPGSWSSPVTWVVWLPMLVFELTLAVWLITKGVATRADVVHAATSV